MKIYRGYKFRMYPNEEQEKLINKTIGSTRFVYNYFLEKKLQGTFSSSKLTSVFLEENTFLKEVDKSALTNAIFNLEDTLKICTKNNLTPKYKVKGIHNSYKTTNFKMSYTNDYSIKLDLHKKVITLPKLKEVPIRGYRHKQTFDGRIINAVIRKEADKYYVSLLVEEEITLPPFIPNHIIGLDLGIKTFLITSHNEKIENKIKLNEKRLKGLQKGLSRCVMGSKNRYKMKIKIQRLFMKIKNARRHLLHNITNKLINENDIIVVEHLDVQNMKQNHTIAKSLNENPISEIIRVLSYKALWNNKKLIQIGKYYPSSQLCNICGYQNKKVKDLSIRNWECPICKREHDRDVNAAINIMYEGLKIYMQTINREVITS